jgi:hypothetical protein
MLRFHRFRCACIRLATWPGRENKEKPTALVDEGQNRRTKTQPASQFHSDPEWEMTAHRSSYHPQFLELSTNAVMQSVEVELRANGLAVENRSQLVPRSHLAPGISFT